MAGVDVRSWFCGGLKKTSEIERLVEDVHFSVSRAHPAPRHAKCSTHSMPLQRC
jgi:hypothetical protein